jgi:hypothetical protein
MFAYMGSSSGHMSSEYFGALACLPRPRSLACKGVLKLQIGVEHMETTQGQGEKDAEAGEKGTR